MLYVGAVEGSGRYLRPDQVTRMTDRQSRKVEDDERLAWAKKSLNRSAVPERGRWYAPNTREPIRDETLREGLMRAGAVIARDDLPTTSSHPRYALRQSFARIFDPALVGDTLDAAVAAWQRENLSSSARARIELVRRAAVASASGIRVRFPNEDTRLLGPGPSSVIAQAVVEEFAPRFLRNPAVLFLSDSGTKTVAREDELAAAIGLRFPPDRVLPDLVLVDLGPEQPTLVFVEVVASEGPMTPMRRESLAEIATSAGFASGQLAFVTAYLDRGHVAARRTMSELAWNSFVWFAAEPDSIVSMIGERRGRSLTELM